jgi:hypothetical protein
MYLAGFGGSLRGKTETLRTTDSTDIPDKGRPGKTEGNEGSKGRPESDQTGIIFVSFAIFC